MPTTLLIVDDSAAVRALVRDFFETQGYRVLGAADGQSALDVVRDQAPDLVLLDVMMPGLDGFDVIRSLRRRGEIPVILLTARTAEADKVVGLELGADDFVAKPFSMHELQARIRAVLRRSRQRPDAGAVLRHRDLTMDRDRRRVDVLGKTVVLTRSEFTVLETLLGAPGRVFSRAQLLRALGSEGGVERTVDVHIRNLRSKIEPEPSRPVYVLTEFGVGYRLGE